MKIPEVVRLRTDIPISRETEDEHGAQIFQALSVSNGNLTTNVFGEVNTLYEGFRRGVRISRKANCLGWRESAETPYVWMTYEQAEIQAKEFGSGLLANGLQPGQGCRIGIYSQNTPQYAIIMQACFMYSISIVPLYDTLGPDACTFIIKHAQLGLVVCDDPSKAKLLLSRVGETPSLKTIVVTKMLTAEIKAMASRANIQLISYEELLTKGQKNERDAIPPHPEDDAIVCFTSGTTGNPKGVVLTHRNFCTTIGGVLQTLEILHMDHTDVLISYLPLAHVFEQLMENTFFLLGASIGYYRGDIKTATSDMQALKPTVLPIVPRILNKVYDNAQALVSSSAIKKKLFSMGMKKKQALLNEGHFINDTIWDKLLFKKLRDRFGGRVKLIVTGSAPLAAPVMQFARCAMGAMVLEGYGQTECMGACTVQMPGDIAAGDVGTPHPGNYIKLVDVPEMDYYARDRKGEICVKGSNVFAGYLNDEEKTKEAIDSDGWLHTGDIGVFTDRGTLQIIDRKKHIFKLSQGEYLAPEKIENVYIRCNLVAQIMVHGNSLKSSAVAIIVPEEEQVMNWAERSGFSGKSFSELTQELTLKNEILTALKAIGKEDGLKSFEQVRDVHLSAQLWSVENDFLTPTFKTKRPALTKHFKNAFDKMYENLD